MNEKQVEHLVENLDKAKQYLFKAKTRTTATVITWLENSCIAYLKRQMKELEGEYKKVVNTLLNSAQTLHEGLSSGDADLDDAIDVGKEFRVAVAKVELLKDKEDQKKSKPELKADQEAGRDKLIRMTDESKPVILKYRAWKDDLPNNLFRKLFVIHRMPVIPLTDPQLNFEKLRKAKMATDHISFYPIILNQPILGINHAWIMETFKGNPLKAAEYVIDAAKDKFGKTYHPTGRPVHIDKVVWYWIPSDKDVARIQAASPVGRLSVKQWGFPFNL